MKPWGSVLRKHLVNKGKVAYQTKDYLHYILIHNSSEYGLAVTSRGKKTKNKRLNFFVNLRIRYGGKRFSTEQAFDHMTVDIGQAELPSLVTKGQFLMVDPT